ENGTEGIRLSATSSGSVHPGNVGIGTASPISLLNLSSSTLGGTGEVGITIQNTASGGGNYRLWVSDNGNGEGSNKFFILDNSSNQVRLAIDGSGHVGIDKTGPAQALDVSGNVQFSGALMPGGSAGTSGQFLQSTGSGATWATLS